MYVVKIPMKYFMIDCSLILRPFMSFACRVLSIVLCESAADSHLKLLDRVVRSAIFLNQAVYL